MPRAHEWDPEGRSDALSTCGGAAGTAGGRCGAAAVLGHGMRDWARYAGLGTVCMRWHGPGHFCLGAAPSFWLKAARAALCCVPDLDLVWKASLVETTPCGESSVMSN